MSVYCCIIDLFSVYLVAGKHFEIAKIGNSRRSCTQSAAKEFVLIAEMGFHYHLILFKISKFGNT